MTTKEKIESILKSNKENYWQADAILARLKEKWEGKKLTQRVITDLRTHLDFERIYLNKIGSMSQIEFGNKYNKNDNCISLLISYESTPIVDTNKIKNEYNRCYFDAAEKRNKEREIALNEVNEHEIISLANAIDAYNESYLKIKSILQYGDPLSVESLNIEKLR